MADCSELAKLIYQAARATAAQPGFGSVDAVFTELQKSIPSLDRRLFVNSLAEASAARQIDLTQAQKQVARMMREARGDKAALDHLDSLQKHLEEGVSPQRPRKASEVSAWRQAVNSDIKRLRRVVAESDPARVQRLQKQIDAVEKRLAENEFAAPVNTKELKVSQEVNALEEKLERVRKQVRARVRDAAPKKWYEHLAHVTGLQKALITTGDLAPALRQGILFSLAHPVKSAQNWVSSLKAIGSEEAASRVQKSIAEREEFPGELRRVGVTQRDWDGSLDNATEDFASKWLMPSDFRYDPRRLPAALGRGFTVYTNLIRADLYNAMKDTALAKGGGTQQDLETLAKVANYATGDIPLGKFETSAHALNLGFFSARYWASQIAAEVAPYVAAASEAASPAFKLFGKEVKVMSSAAARQAVLKEYVRAGTGMLSVLFAAALGSSGSQDELEEEMQATIDPRSPYFMKPKILGVRHDVSGGLGKYTVLVSKSVLGQRLDKRGKTVLIRGSEAAYKEDDAFDLSTRLVRGKLAALPSTYFDWTTGKTITGDDVTVLGTVGNLVVPMSHKDIYDQAQTQGMDRPMSNLVSGFLTMIGSSPYIEQPRNTKLKPGKYPATR